MSSFKTNLVANYLSQIYVTVIGIVLVPVYVRYMGVEAYGLVGFYAMLQAWFQLLDLGLTPTLARETARFRGGALDLPTLRRLLRALEGVFLGIALLGGGLVVLGAQSIALRWIRVEHLPLETVWQSVALMGGVMSCRWVSGLYRGAINGFERIVWLGTFNAAMATIRFVVIIPIFLFVGVSPVLFFMYQFVTALLELVTLAWKTYRLMPRPESWLAIPWEWEPLRGVLKFSMAVAFAGSVWVLVTQTDKIILSKFLTLTEYGYYSLVVVLAGGVTIVSGPISGVLLPRMSRLSAEGDSEGVKHAYSTATQIVSGVAFPVALVLAVFPQAVLVAWTGNPVIAAKAAPVLRLYALGNACMAVSSFAYFLQFAKGNLRLHVLGSGLFLLLLVPGLAWATWRNGVIGAAWVWLIANLIYLLLWVPLVHARFLEGYHWRWLTRDVAQIALPTALLALVLKEVLVWPRARWVALGLLSGVGTLLMLVAVLASPWMWNRLRAKLGTQ